MRMFWGNSTRRKDPSPRLSAITAPGYGHDEELESSDSSTGESSPHPDMNAQDIEQNLLSISKDRQRIMEDLSSPKRPSLDEILADRSPSPWTFKAFNAYCSHNMCSENLNFIIDAGIYRDTHLQWRTEHPEDTKESSDDARSFQLNKMWKRIFQEYITPNGLQEVNLSGSIRDQLMSIPSREVPPNPEVLMPAVRQIHALLEDSILLSFLNENRPVRISSEEKTSRKGVTPQLQPATRQKHTNPQSSTPTVITPPLQPIKMSGRERPKRSEQLLSSSAPNSNSMPHPLYNRPSGIFSPKLEPQHHSSHLLQHSYPHHNSMSGATDREGPPIMPTTSSSDDAIPTLSHPTSHDSQSSNPSRQPTERRLSPWSTSNNSNAWKKLGSKLGLKRRPSNQRLRTGGDMAVDEDEEEEEES